MLRFVKLEFIETKLVALFVRVSIEQEENSEDRRVTDREDDEDPLLVLRQHDELETVQRLDFSFHARIGEHDAEYKLQRINEEENGEEQREIENDRDAIFESVAAEERVLRVPETRQHDECDDERAEAAHRRQKFRRRLRHFERHDEQRDRKSEYGVAESFDARDLMTAPAETVDGLAEHGSVYPERQRRICEQQRQSPRLVAAARLIPRFARDKLRDHDRHLADSRSDERAGAVRQPRLYHPGPDRSP